jgi:hypothetical protein
MPDITILKSIEIDRVMYGENKDTYEGRIRFDNKRGDITLNLEGENIQKVIDLLADEIVDQTILVADTLRAETITMIKPALESVPEDSV